MGKEERIEEALKKLHLETENIFSVRDLNDIARESHCADIDVMMYLRYGRHRSRRR